MADVLEVPFYDCDGVHQMTVEVESDDAGTPPPLVWVRSSAASRGVEYQFGREFRPGESPPWAYVEISHRWFGEPTPGSAEALQRVLESERWPG